MTRVSLRVNQRRETGENQNRKLSRSFSVKGRREMGEMDQGRSKARRSFLFSFYKMGEIVAS